MCKNAFVPHALDVLVTAWYNFSRFICIGDRILATRAVPSFNVSYRIATFLANGRLVRTVCDVIIAVVILPQLVGARFNDALVVAAAFSFGADFELPSVNNRAIEADCAQCQTNGE